MSHYCGRKTSPGVEIFSHNSSLMAKGKPAGMRGRKAADPSGWLGCRELEFLSPPRLIRGGFLSLFAEEI